MREVARGSVGARLRSLQLLRRTPLHPQWLLGTQTAVTHSVQLHAKGRVLDIGCADRWVQAHIPDGCEYIAMDHPYTGGSMYASRPDVFGDAARLPFADSSVDTVLLFEVIEHLRFPGLALSEIARVLKPGGHLLLSVPFLYPIHDAPYDFQRYTCYGLVRELGAAGFDADKPEPSLGTVESGGLVLTIALGGLATEAITRHKGAIIWLPVFALGIAVINLCCWLLGRVAPQWPAVTAGYHVRAIRR